MAKGRGRKNAIPKAKVVEGADAPSATTSSETNLPPYATRRFWRLVILVLLVMGMVFSLQINSWHLTVPVVVLWFGWGGVLATVALIWDAGLSVAGEGSGDRMAELDVSESRRHELEAEKKSLIQAIKEIEFDRDLGKMSAEDATEMMKFYRARAIEVIKELDGQVDEELTVSERVKRDLEARLAVAGQGRKRPAKPAVVEKKSVVKKKSEAKPSGNDEEADKADAATKDSADPKSPAPEEEAEDSADSNVKESA